MVVTMFVSRALDLMKFLDSTSDRRAALRDRLRIFDCLLVALTAVDDIAVQTKLREINQ